VNRSWTYVLLGALGFAVPVTSALVVALVPGRNEGAAFVAVLMMGVFNQIPFLGLAFQLNRKTDPVGRRIEQGNRSHRKAVIVEFVSLVAVNAWVSVGIARDHSDMVGFPIMGGLMFSCVAMALGYLATYFVAEFLTGLLGEKKEMPRNEGC
jgi:hypothetical protein